MGVWASRWGCRGWIIVGLWAAWGTARAEVPADALADLASRASQTLLESQRQDGRWGWDIDASRSSMNIGGVVAEALLQGYEHTGESTFLKGALRYGRGLVERYDDAPDTLPYKPDVAFLVRLSAVSGQDIFADVARRWFALVMRRSPSGSLEYRRIAQGRHAAPDLVGYDVALAIRAALAVGETVYARALADAAVVFRDRWLRKPDSTFGLISRSALVRAMREIDALAYAGTIAPWVQEILAEQHPNGSWRHNETQSTAYALLALSGSDRPEVRAAATRAVRWLAGSLLTRARWATFNDGLPEPFVGEVLTVVQAEALSAVVAASVR